MKLTACVVGRTLLKVALAGKTTPIPNGNPIAMAVGALGLLLDSELLFKSFLEEGGIPALVRHLQSELTCTLTKDCTINLISALVEPTMALLLASEDLRSEVAGLFLSSGKRIYVAWSTTKLGSPSFLTNVAWQQIRLAP